MRFTMPTKIFTRLKDFRLTWQGFPFQLFLFTVLPLSILLIVIAFGSMSLHLQAMRSLVGDRDLRAVRAAANSLSQEFAHQAAVLEFVQENAVDEEGAVQILNRSSNSLKGFDQGVALFSPDGKLLFSTASARSWSKDLPEFIKALSALPNGRAQAPVFTLTTDSASGNPMVLTSLRLSDGAILVGAFSPAIIFQNGLDGSVVRGVTTVYVVDSKYQVLYRMGSPISREQLAYHPGIASALKGESGIDYYPTPEGEHVVAFSPIAPMGWALMIEEPWETIYSPLLRTTQEAPFILVPLLLVVLAVLWFLIRQIAQPLQALESRTAELAEGNFDAIRKPVGGIPEIRRLQAELINMAEKLNAAQESLHTYIGAITAGIENERHNLARELHDDTIQTLIALNQRIQLSAMGTHKTDAQEARQELQQMVQQAMLNLRRIIRGLRPIYLEDLGLAAALGMLGQEVSQASGLNVNFRVNGSERRLEPVTELALYRIAQEALSNVMRHANAKNAWIELDYQSTCIQLSVKDDGNGFAVPKQPGNLVQKGHFGLLGMRERADLIHGKLEIISAPGKGTVVTVRLDCSRMNENKNGSSVPNQSTESWSDRTQ